MEDKWKEFMIDGGLRTIGAATQATWTTFLVWATNKIPYVGIPIATLLGVTGFICTVWVAKGGSNRYRNCDKQYCTVE